jgi:hypothetical protein
MIDNGAKARVMLSFVREGLTKFIDTMPKDEKGMGLISLSLLTTAPAPRFLVRDSKDYAEFKKSVGQISPEPDDGAFGRFSDSLVEYSRRLDDEFRTVGPEQLPPYLPILISVSTTTQDGSDVRGLDVKNMIVSLVRHRVSTNFVMVNPSKSANINDGVNELTVDADAAQIGEIANAVRDATHGQYFALGGSGSSSIASKHLPDLATQVSYRFIKQMFQHQVIVERAAGVTTPLSVKDIGLSINRPGVQYQFAFDPFIP